MCKAWQLIFSCFSLCALVKRCLRLSIPLVYLVLMLTAFRPWYRVHATLADGILLVMLVCARLRHVAGTQWGCKKYMNMKHLEAAPDDAFIAG